MMWLTVKLIDARNAVVKAGKNFVSGNEEGASAVEYGIMVALIAGVIVASVTALGAKLVTVFTSTTAALP
jgi:pilus assembly protein Flp/PilA